jgi:hypothetical protein
MPDVDRLVLNTVNAPWRRQIDALALTACLEGARPMGRWSEHVRTFFEDVPREAMFRFFVAHRISPRAVLCSYRNLVSPSKHAHGDLEDWLAELAEIA